MSEAGSNALGRDAVRSRSDVTSFGVWASSASNLQGPIDTISDSTNYALEHPPLTSNFAA